MLHGKYIYISSHRPARNPPINHTHTHVRTYPWNRRMSRRGTRRRRPRRWRRWLLREGHTPRHTDTRARSHAVKRRDKKWESMAATGENDAKGGGEEKFNRCCTSRLPPLVLNRLTRWPVRSRRTQCPRACRSPCSKNTVQQHQGKKRFIQGRREHDAASIVVAKYQRYSTNLCLTDVRVCVCARTRACECERVRACLRAPCVCVCVCVRARARRLSRRTRRRKLCRLRRLRSGQKG